jgi:tRNA/tmRNA/rRNA uracil-C5-methylase (TrmA/RlmC/RlmD family)
VILTPYVLPGERVEVEAGEERAGLLRARLLRVVTPAPERIAAVCPYFARCGGCQCSAYQCRKSSESGKEYNCQDCHFTKQFVD